MPEAKGKKSAAPPKSTSPANQPSAGDAGKKTAVTGPARLYGDEVPTPPSQSPAPPPAGGVKRGRRPSPKPPKVPSATPDAAPSGEADVKPREHVAKGNKTPAVRTTKPKT